jgi:hypothetical protein
VGGQAYSAKVQTGLTAIKLVMNILNEFQEELTKSQPELATLVDKPSEWCVWVAGDPEPLREWSNISIFSFDDTTIYFEGVRNDGCLDTQTIHDIKSSETL